MKQNFPAWFLPFLLIFIGIIISGFLSCDTTEPPDDGNSKSEPDTTTQNFTFETFEFGDGYSSSYFKDVWVFDEKNIWAVGWVSSAPKSGRTNIVRWNGKEWFGFGGQFSSSGFEGIWAVDSTDIFFAVGAVIRFKDGRFIEYNLGGLGFSQGQAVRKLWGSSADNIWGVGPWGTIVHFDGVSWSKIEFDTDWYFYDLTGDPINGVCYAIAKKSSQAGIIKLNNGEAKIIFEESNEIENLSFKTDEFIAENHLWLAGLNIWNYDVQLHTLIKRYDLARGTSINIMSAATEKDIYFMGYEINGKFILIHYNGKRFNKIKDFFETNIYYGNIYSTTSKTIFAGAKGEKAYILIIKRL